MQHESMSIKVREPEPTHELSLSKQGWLELLAFLTECQDSASTEAMVLVADGMIKQARAFVLSKDKPPEFRVDLSREQCLDLFLFFGEFKEQVKESSVLSSIQSGFKGFLLGGSDEH